MIVSRRRIGSLLLRSTHRGRGRARERRSEKYPAMPGNRHYIEKRHHLRTRGLDSVAYPQRAARTDFQAGRKDADTEKGREANEAPSIRSLPAVSGWRTIRDAWALRSLSQQPCKRRPHSPSASPALYERVTRGAAHRSTNERLRHILPDNPRLWHTEPTIGRQCKRTTKCRAKCECVCVGGLDWRCS